MLFSQPKLQKAVHQAPNTTSQAVVPPSGGVGCDEAAAAFSESDSSCNGLVLALLSNGMDMASL